MGRGFVRQVVRGALAVAGLGCGLVGSLGGCDRILGIEQTRLAPEPEPDVLVCADAVVPMELGTTPIDTEAAADDVVLSCGQAGAGDLTFAFTAPVTDYYVFDTFGSRFDTVLALYDQCDGTELACSNNVGAVPQSELVRKMEAQQKALLAVEGFAGDRGTGALRVSRVTCPDADLEGRALPVDLSTVSFGDDTQSSCGGAGQEDRAYHWVAPRDGLFAFQVSAPTFTPAISLHAGPRCSDRALGCNAADPTVRTSEVVRRLSAGQQVSLLVDGVNGAGAFTVNVQERAGACPQAEIKPGLGYPPQQVGPRTLAPSCSPVKFSGDFGGQYEMRDKVYSFVVPQADPTCSRSCQLTLRASAPMVLYVLDGDDCGGPERSCQPTAFEGGEHVARLTLLGNDAAATRYTLVAGSVSAAETTFSLTSLVCPNDCP